MLTLFAGAGLLSLSLMAGLWLPRRRLSLTLAGRRLRLGVRGEPLDSPGAELDHLRVRIARVLASEPEPTPAEDLDQRR
jgi:hypothetical protein